MTILDDFHVRMAGKRYRPSNGSEGCDFMDHWCELCVHNLDDFGCEIANRAFWYDEDHPDYPGEWIYASDGSGPTCTAFKEINSHGRAK